MNEIFRPISDSNIMLVIGLFMQSIVATNDARAIPSAIDVCSVYELQSS